MHSAAFFFYSFHVFGFRQFYCHISWRSFYRSLMRCCMGTYLGTYEGLYVVRLTPDSVYISF